MKFMSEDIERVASWVDGEQTRSVIMEYCSGHWEVVFNAAMMDPVRFASARGEDPVQGLQACLEVCFEAVGADKLTHREQLEATFGPVTDDQWQWLKEFTAKNWIHDCLSGVVGYRNTRTRDIYHPSEIEIIKE